MSKRDSTLLINDMLIAIGKIKAYTEGLDFEKFMADSKTVEAVERNFEIIGEAANQLPVSFRETHSFIQWHSVVSLRNRLIHGYFGVDYHILWHIVQNDLVHLEKQLISILQ
jgi:uncharacterized protein with HEPN domain